MNILHLSDIHFKYPVCKTDGDPELPYRQVMLQSLKENAKQFGAVDAILVTGDIAFRGIEEEFDYAFSWFNDVADAVGCKKEQFYIVPGNHDVDRSVVAGDRGIQNAHLAISVTKDLRSCEKELATQLGDKNTGAALFKSIQAYNKFASRYNCQVNSNREFWVNNLRINENTVLRLRGMTSTILSGQKGKDDNEKDLYLGPRQTSVGPSDGCVNLIMAHHPPSWMRDREEIEGRLLGQPNVLLFGHMHRQLLRRDVDGPLVISAGSVNPERHETGWSPAYNFINVTVDGKEEVRNAIFRIRQYEWQSSPDCFRAKLNNGADYFDHVISISGYCINTSSGHQPSVDSLVENDVNDAENKCVNEEFEEEILQAPNERNLVWRFWNLSSEQQYSILLEMEYLAESTIVEDETEEYRTIMLKIVEAGQVTEFADKIQKFE